jgi:type I restriction enzyme, S subunit
VNESPLTNNSGWEWTTIGQVGHVQLGRQRSPKNRSKHYATKYLRAANLTWAGLNLSDLLDMEFRPNERETYRLMPGDILLSEASGSAAEVGKPAIWCGELDECCFQNTVIRFRSHGPDPRYMLVVFQHLARSGIFAAIARGVGIHHLGAERFASIPVPVPPIAEQRRIVAAIEEQFTRLDAAVASLQRARANLKRYRASVLFAATNGQLVPTEAQISRASGVSCETGLELRKRILENRRDNRPARVAGWSQSDPTAAELQIVRGLPEGWSTVTVEELTPKSRSCAYSVLQPGPEVPDGVPLVRVGDVDQGRVPVGPLKRIARAIADKYPRTKLQGGEVLITLVGTIGRTALVPESLRGANVARAVGVIPVTEQILPAWVEIWFRNPDRNTGDGRQGARGRTKTLNLEDVRSSVVGLPPVDEQHRIVAEVERRLSAVDEAESAILVNLRRAARLREAILKRAFEGKLVGQGPIDEPAGVLIERIRNERPTTEGTARIPRRRVTRVKLSPPAAQEPLPI